MAAPSKFLEHALNTGATLFGAWLIFQGSQTETEPKYVEQLQSRISELESRQDPLRAQIFELRLQKAELVAALGGNIFSIERGALSSVVDAFGTAAWCKKVIEPEVLGGLPSFEMEDINPPYETRYDVDEDKYRGQTDFDIHPQHIAEQYFANDMRIYRDRNYQEFREAGDGENGIYRSEEDFAKFWVPLPLSGVNFVCGFLLNRV